jgi:hypothetical protein
MFLLSYEMKIQQITVKESNFMMKFLHADQYLVLKFSDDCV